MSTTMVAAATNSHSQRSVSYITRPTQSLCLSVKVRDLRKVSWNRGMVVSHLGRPQSGRICQ